MLFYRYFLKLHCYENELIDSVCLNYRFDDVNEKKTTEKEKIQSSKYLLDLNKNDTTYLRKMPCEKENRSHLNHVTNSFVEWNL